MGIANRNRLNPSRLWLLVALAVVPSVFANPAKNAAGAHASANNAASTKKGPVADPIDVQLRVWFPSVAIESRSTIEPAQELVAGRPVTGMRARQTASVAHPEAQATAASANGPTAGALRVFYPGSYDDSFVAEAGNQRVAIRAVGAHFAAAAVSGGKLIYSNAHDSVDVVEVPGAGRSEELLLLRDARAPRVFEFEIVEMRGVGSMSLNGGALRFAPDHVDIPAISQTAGGRFTAPQPSLQIDRPWVIDASGKRSDTAAEWTIVEKNGQAPRIRLTLDTAQLAFPLLIDPTISTTGSMNARAGHTATVLPSGKVLVAGGTGTGAVSGAVASAELYDPATGTFAATGSMSGARVFFTATLLPNGKVLVAGGQSASSAFLQSAELYDPSAGTFTPTGNMTVARGIHTATLLPNGKVLIVGGQTDAVTFQATAELYNPFTSTFTATTAPMSAARANHTATLLPNGTVLVTGGLSGSAIVTAAPQLYDPAADTFAAAGNMITARAYHSATLLPNGTVFVAGGSTVVGAPGYVSSGILASTEIYNPASKTFASAASLPSVRRYHTATLMPSGNVLLTGGDSALYTIMSDATLWNPVAGTTVWGASMSYARILHTATLMPGGKVLITGGGNVSTIVLNTAELFEEAADTFAGTGSMNTAREVHTSTLLPNGKVFVAGGAGAASMGAELFDAAFGTFAPAGNLITYRMNHTATLLPNGKVLLAGGYTGVTITNTAELYDPALGTFLATGTMNTARMHHTATLLPSGRVLIAGGSSNVGVLATAELYDTVSGTFVPTGSMTGLRYSQSATLLSNGKVLIAGGGGAVQTLATAELYDPALGTFTATPNMINPHINHVATLLPDGKVLFAGASGASVQSAAELFDPLAVSFSATGSMTATGGREYPTATLLPNGKVLITGGMDPLFVLSTAELYDPAFGTFSAAAMTMSTTRYQHTATLLPSGKVLITGGHEGGPFGGWVTSSAELYDVSSGYANARRPVVSSLTNPLCQPANLALSGSLFTGDSEGSNGAANSSASNAPLLHLQRIDNDQISFALPQLFSASAYFSTTLSGMPSGRYRASVFSNGIPSVEQIFEVETTPLVGTYSAVSIPITGSATVTPVFYPAGYNGALYPIAVSASAGFTGSVGVSGTAGVVSVSNAGPPGTYTITVLSSTNCGAASATFTLDVIGPPASVTATGGTPQNGQTGLQFVSPLQATVRDSSGHLLNNITVIFTAPASGASATFAGGSAQTNASGVASIAATANGTLGNYNASAVVGAFTANFALTNTPDTPTSTVATATTPTSVSVSWNGTSGATYEVQRISAGGSLILGTSLNGTFPDNAAVAGTAYLYEVRAIAPSATAYGLPDLATTVIFTDPTITPGSTTVKAAHFTELRTAVNAVRTLAGLGAFAFTDPALTPGATTIMATHVTDLRTALGSARALLPLPVLPYTNPSITAGTSMISAADLNDLRAGVQ